MKITKAMGRACLLGLADPSYYKQPLEDGLAALGWKWRRGTAQTDGILWSDKYRASDEHYQTALALCAAIAGVKPEDVE